MSCKNLSSARLCPQALPVTNIRHVHWKKWIPPFFPAKKILQIQKNTPKVQKDMYKCWTKRNLSVTQSLSVDTFPISVCPIISKWCLFYPFTPVITVGNLDTGNCMFRGHLRVFVGHFHSFQSCHVIFIRPRCLIYGCQWVSTGGFWDLTDVIVADEDTNSILTSNAYKSFKAMWQCMWHDLGLFRVRKTLKNWPL